MTKKRLKELIKQNGLIFDKYGSEIDLKSGDGIYFAFSQNRLFKMKEMPNIALEHWRLNEIFETEEQAEWHLKNDAERTERFEPPMWEDLQEDLEVIDYKFAFTINGNCNYIFLVAKGERGGSIEITEFNVYKVEPTLFYSAPASKENYEKACEIVRDLFGGKNE